MTNDDRLERLIALYQSVINEISVLRDQEWKITQLFVLFGVGVIGLCLNEESRNFIKISWINYTLIALEVFIIIFGSYHLVRTHYFLTLHRKLRREIETELKFHDKEYFHRKKSFLPSKWSGKIKFRFELFSLLLPFLIFNLFVHFFAIYLIFKLHRQ